MMSDPPHQPFPYVNKTQISRSKVFLLKFTYNRWCSLVYRQRKFHWLFGKFLSLLWTITKIRWLLSLRTIEPVLLLTKYTKEWWCRCVDHQFSVVDTPRHMNALNQQNLTYSDNIRWIKYYVYNHENRHEQLRLDWKKVLVDHQANYQDVDTGP